MAADVASPAGSVSTKWNNEIYIHVYSYLAKMRRERERERPYYYTLYPRLGNPSLPHPPPFFALVLNK
jgi:hypothetical protein